MNESSLTFVGTATLIIRLGSFTLLTDPNFLHQGQRAYLGKGLWSKRVTEPARQPYQLPDLDLAVLSHLHGDHFDRVARRHLSRLMPVITTPHAARRLGRVGLRRPGAADLGRGDVDEGERDPDGAGAAGDSRPGVMGALLPPVMGSLLEHRVDGATRLRLYVSGDTLTGDHISEIARREPDIDVAVMHLGGTRVLLHTVTMDAGPGGRLPHQAPTSSGGARALRRLSRLQVPTVRLRTRDSRRRPRRPDHV